MLSLGYNQLGDAVGDLIKSLGDRPLGSTGPLQELRKLSLAGNAMNDKALNALGKSLEQGALSKLAHLDVCGNQITSLAPLCRAAAVRPLHLDCLKAEDNALRDDSVVALVRSSCDGQIPDLHTLWLGGNELSDDSLKVRCGQPWRREYAFPRVHSVGGSRSLPRALLSSVNACAQRVSSPR